MAASRGCKPKDIDIDRVARKNVSRLIAVGFGAAGAWGIDWIAEKLLRALEVSWNFKFDPRVYTAILVMVVGGYLVFLAAQTFVDATEWVCDAYDAIKDRIHESRERDRERAKK